MIQGPGRLFHHIHGLPHREPAGIPQDPVETFSPYRVQNQADPILFKKDIPDALQPRVAYPGRPPRASGDIGLGERGIFFIIQTTQEYFSGPEPARLPRRLGRPETLPLRRERTPRPIELVIEPAGMVASIGYQTAFQWF